MATKRIASALISVFSKDGLEPLVRLLHQYDVVLYASGGTQQYIESLGLPVISVESLTDYPSILDGRVKTLHPKVFGGILARRESGHLEGLARYQIPEIDLVLVDLYPFEETLASTSDEKAIIEKIDIGGISLIRAAAKNYQDVVIVPSRNDYPYLEKLLQDKGGVTELEDRFELARRAFLLSSTYDTAIFSYFNRTNSPSVPAAPAVPSEPLRYGENPHQKAVFSGDLDVLFDKLGGKALSYNNLLDLDAALSLLAEFQDEEPTFAIIKHNNACGVATRESVLQAWEAALACDPLSAFGGILACNRPVDIQTAAAIDHIFYEVLIAPDYSPEAAELLLRKKNRVLLKLKTWQLPATSSRSLLNGTIQQDNDLSIELPAQWTIATTTAPDAAQSDDLLFALKCVKHLKSNAISIVKNRQLIGMGCGQTSRIDALRQAVEKAQRMGFDPAGAVLASDAFFPFADSVEQAYAAGISAIIQPGGSLRDADSIAFCDAHRLPMVLTGIRHFKH